MSSRTRALQAVSDEDVTLMASALCEYENRTREGSVLETADGEHRLMGHLLPDLRRSVTWIVNNTDFIQRKTPRMSDDDFQTLYATGYLIRNPDNDQEFKMSPQGWSRVREILTALP